MEGPMSQISYNLSEWIKSLPSRKGWGRWDGVGASVFEGGVQNWSANGDERTAVGVWGNVVQPEEGPAEVNWCVYVGDNHDPEKCGFDSAEAAMRWAERTFLDQFKETRP